MKKEKTYKEDLNFWNLRVLINNLLTRRECLEAEINEISREIEFIEKLEPRLNKNDHIESKNGN